MKLFSTALIAAWLSVALTSVQAQTGFQISGKLTGVERKPLDGATVYLLTSPDSTLLKTALADSAGSFSFPQLKQGDYIISISMTGYADYKTPVIHLTEDKIIEPINLTASGTLQNVVVTAQRPFVERRIDKTIVNPDALISNAGSTALDVLEKAPGVIVDQNGGVTLRGKGVTIFIDDKPTYLSGNDLQNYLRSLGAAGIDQIELMTNPPAKYDAAGNGGVINIRTKKTKMKGFNGTLNLAYNQGRYGRTNNSLNFNWRAGKLNVFGNISYNNSNMFTDLLINRHFYTNAGDLFSNFEQHSFIRNKGSNYLAKIGADYYLTEKATIGINFTGIYNSIQRNTPVSSFFTNAANQPDSTILAYNNQDNTFRHGSINLNYRYQFKKDGPQLSADVNYLNYYTNNQQSFDNRSFYTNGSPQSSDLLTGSLPAHFDIYSGKIDYEHPLAKGTKLSAGLKSSFTQTDNVADYFYSSGGVTAPDYDKTNHFLYEENINAAYLNASRELKRFSFQAGLRLENTVYKGHQLGNIQKPDSAFRRTYNSLFPTLYVQYKADTADKNVFSIDYGRRIDRPYYQDLNPFLSPLDKFTYYTGNPFLRPSFTDNIELSHTYRNRYTTTLSYSRTRDNVNETIEIKDGTYYSRPGNIGKYTVATISFDATMDPWKWLNIQFHGHAEQIHSVSNFYTGKLDTKGAYYFVRPVFSFKAGKDWTFQLEGGYQSKVTNAQFEILGKGRVNAAVAKKFPKGNIKLVFNDFLYTFRTRGIINNLQNTRADWVNVFDSRQFILSFSYRFGKALTGQRRHDASGAETEQNRVKN